MTPTTVAKTNTIPTTNPTRTFNDVLRLLSSSAKMSRYLDAHLEVSI